MRKIILTACLCLLFTAGTSMADYLYWNLDTGSGNVDDVTNWTCTWPVGNPDKVPGDGDLAIIKKNGTVLIDATHLFSGIPTDIWVGDGTGINNPIDDWPHSPNDPGEGHVLQTGGTVNYAYWFLVGRANAPGTSTYDMQGGAITQTEAGGLFIIGEAGATGIMTVSNDAAISVLTPAYIGTGGGGSGTLSLSGTSTAMFSEVHLGESATGAINLSDSAILTSGGYNIFGTGAGGASTLTMSDDSQFIGGYGHVGGSNSG
ncbi:MAG: hypothetical protein JW709_01075, partial [Sedimentisphaerales bacterium]|nr:hypothetical protein [Sedimentisphaerales bacterium]